MQVNEHLWLFVNHLNEYRYVVSERPPQKVFVYDKKLHHQETLDSYHGSRTWTKNFYTYSDKKIYYWDFEPKLIGGQVPTDDVKVFEPVIIGTKVPDELINEKYYDMDFDSYPVCVKANYTTFDDGYL